MPTSDILTDLDIIKGSWAPRWSRILNGYIGYVFDDFGDEYAIVNTRRRDRVICIHSETSLIRAAYEDDSCGDGTVYEKTSPRQLLSNLYGVETLAELCALDEDEAEGSGWIIDLARAYGWDTDVYRADGYFGEGVYTPEFISEIDAAIYWIDNHDPDDGLTVRRCRVMTDEELEAYFAESE